MTGMEARGEGSGRPLAAARPFRSEAPRHPRARLASSAGNFAGSMGLVMNL